MRVQIMNYRDVIEKLPPDSILILRGITWEEYEELLDAVGEASGLRISYDQGALQIMTLSSAHESYSALIQDLVRLVSLKLRIKVLCFGSSTLKKKRKLKGTEPDICFYVQNAVAIGNKIHIDFNSDPPPDIVVEVDMHHDSRPKFPIYAALGVPEIWRYDGQSLAIYHLQQGEYIPVPSSQALPVLTGGTLTEFLTRSQHEDQYEVLLAFENWLQTCRQ